MKTAVLIKIENVLTKEGVQGSITKPGLALLQLFQSEEHTLFFLTDEDRRDNVLSWLDLETPFRLDDSKVIDAADDDPITTVRYLGWDVLFYIDSNPSRIAYAMNKGVTAILVAAPQYQRPEFRPTHRGPVSPWNELIGAMETQVAEREVDGRGETGPDQRFTE